MMQGSHEYDRSRATTRFSRRLLLVAGLGAIAAACGAARAPSPTPPLAATVPSLAAAADATTVPTMAAPATPTALPTAAPTVAPATMVPSPTSPPATSTVVTAAPATAAPATVSPVPKPTAAPTAPPVPETAAPTDAPGVPVLLTIPRLRISAAVEHVGLAQDGAMEVPKRYDTVGWYKLGSRPGERGSAVLAGHLDSKTGPAIFWRLGDLRPGDPVAVRSDDGVERRFTVEGLETYRYDAAPLQRIFAAADRARLNLITCSGVFDRRAQNYDLRLVVFATLAL
ncbi:MAG: sortase [Chloroflexi bacterium]|nr:sortase [Chloroflexota bacterium]